MHATLVKLWTLRRALLFYAVLLALGWFLGLIFRDFTSIETGSMNEPLIKNFVIVALVAYVVMAAIPFVPGAEIGLALLLMFGPEAAPVVYLGMVGALILSFTIARLVPCRPLCRWLRWLGLERASRLLGKLDAAAPADREQIVLSAVPARLTRSFVRNRYLLLALAINLPGNSVLGGGGGLAFSAGVSGLYRYWSFVAVVAIAVAPVPFAFMLF